MATAGSHKAEIKPHEIRESAMSCLAISLIYVVRHAIRSNPCNFANTHAMGTWMDDWPWLWMPRVVLVGRPATRPNRTATTTLGRVRASGPVITCTIPGPLPVSGKGQTVAVVPIPVATSRSQAVVRFSRCPPAPCHSRFLDRNQVESEREAGHPWRRYQYRHHPQS